MVSGDVTGALVAHETGQHYRIDGVEHMEPFLMTVVSDTDLWMFVSSTGALTAGRRNADHAAFPYQTDDRLHRAAGRVGPVTVIAIGDGAERDVWRPFGPDVQAGGGRSLEKHVSGHRLAFEECHPHRPLRWRATWEPSDAYGWVRTCELINDGIGDLTVEVLDGVVDVMPDGADAFFEQIRSNLVDAYKRSEVDTSSSVAVFNLETLITDRAEPIEALIATTIWSTGLPDATVDLDERAVADMIAGRAAHPRAIVRGRPGAHLRRSVVTLPARTADTWMLAVDVGLGHADVARLADDVVSGRAASAIGADIAAGAARLDDLLGAADAEQHTGDPVADAHHRSNVLFNSMRGGALVDGPNIPMADLAEFVGIRNADVYARHVTWCAAHDGARHVSDVVADALELDDPDLVRLVLEYLPLTFSRRHGDPSRPWNRFDIDVRTPTGDLRLAYEGNWRDIFQNWEALLWTTPAFLPSVVAKFVNATSLEGYNAYRITREGIEWEVPDPADPWSHLGYWGDHQLIYLLRLVEAWRSSSPGDLAQWLDRRVFGSADIPYRLADHARMVEDPRNTIEFDVEHAARIAEREASIGTDGRLLVDDEGGLVRSALAEKLLVPALAKISSFVPGAGIWLNTQRPEWNDANNALAGSGASVVTLFHLRRYLAMLVDVVESAPAPTVHMSVPVAEWFAATADIVDRATVAPTDPRAARRFIDAVGAAAATHRATVRNGVSTSVVAVSTQRIAAMCQQSIEHVDATLATCWRADGLVHSYNLLSFHTPDTVEVGHLDLMLEGQVAALSSGMLAPEAVADMVESSFASGLHRADLDTLLLYPAKTIPAFLDRNLVSGEQEAALNDAGIDGVSLPTAIDRDPTGRLRFHPDIVNAERLAQVLSHSGLADPQVGVVLDVYEEVFDHGTFTGRSARMYGYEGLGSVYWHMVAKLLLAVQECTWSAIDAGAEPDTIARLASAYRRVRDGFGFRMPPALFGAFPTDCYSHSPAHSGAQQPGMTGQVKEEVLTRFGELGLRVAAGRLRLAPILLPVEEILEGGSANFTSGGVSMTIGVGDADEVRVRYDDAERVVAGLTLPLDESQQLFAGRGAIESVDWTLGPGALTRWRSVVEADTAPMPGS